MYDANASIPDDIDKLTSLRVRYAPNPVGFSNIVPLDPLFSAYIKSKIVTAAAAPPPNMPIPALQVDWEVSNPVAFDNSIGFIPFNELAGIAAAGNGDFYVAEKQIKLLYKFNAANPNKAIMWSTNPDPQNGLPHAITVSDTPAHGRRIILLVLRIAAGQQSWHVVILSEENNKLIDSKRIEVPLNPPNAEWLTSITTDVSGNIYISSVKHIIRLQPDGASPQHMRIYPDTTNDSITSLAVAQNNGSVLVLNKARANVAVFAAFVPSATPVAARQTWGKPGTLTGEFQAPCFITTANQSVYITDQGNQRIQKFDLNGTFLAQGGGPATPAQNNGTLDRPAFLAVTTDGLYIIDAGGYPQKVIHAADLVQQATTPSQSPTRKSSIKTIDLRLASWAHSLKALQAEYALAENVKAMAQARLDYLIQNMPTDDETIDIAQQALHHAESELEAIDETLKSFQFFLRGEGYRGSADQLVRTLLETHGNNLDKYQEIISGLKDSTQSADIRKYRIGRGNLIDQYGIPLFEHLKQFNSIEDHKIDNILIIPLLENDELDDDELANKLLIVANPVFNKKQLRPPSILFEEKYNLYVTWSSIALGELAHTESLIPGETRTVLLETTRKKSIQTTYKSKRMTSAKQARENVSTSIRKDDFEDKIHQSFKDTEQSSKKNTAENTTKFNMDYNFKFLELFSLSAKGDYSNARTIKSGSSSTLSSITERVSDIVKKAQKEVSENNKVSFTSESSTEDTYEESISLSDLHVEKSEIHLENINEGKTINYLFFQITNNYSSLLKAEELNIYIDSGIELFEGSGITASGVYDAEQYMSIYHDYDIFPPGNDLRRDIVNAICADMLLRYIKIGQADTSGESPKLLDVQSMTHNALRSLRQALRDVIDPLTASGVDAVFTQQHPSGLFAKIQNLQTAPVVTEPLQVGEELLYQVNTNSYFVDAHMGFMPSTEEYLQIRRKIETEKQQAIVDELRKKISAGVFHTPLPEGITALSTDQTQP